MTDQNQLDEDKKRRRANLYLAFILGAVALTGLLWPLYALFDK